MQEDLDWTLELLDNLKTKDSAALIAWLGVVESEEDDGNQRAIAVKPSNPRLSRIVVILELGALERISLNGDAYGLPFGFLSAHAKGFKRTFNTYDPVDDEQFMFYPGWEGTPIVALESWIPPEEQTETYSSIRFRNIILHLNHRKVPYHFRDGWHLILPPE
ncbi:MAG: hypothetical protein EOO16_15800 [Chitinophagaceae bacterium]|nr:MAG: hypothetical protein EOO16_15800 [Chitinophagaceae bacterium]